MAFDGYLGGSGDWLVSSATLQHGIEKRDFTVAAWVYRVAGYSGTFWYSNGSVGANFGVGVTNFSGGSWFIWCSGGYNFDATISTGVWTHLAVVRRNGTFYGYVNGVLEPTTRTVSQALTTNVSQYVGGGDSGTYAGRVYIQEFGLWTTDLTDREVKSLAMRKACSTQQPSKLTLYVPLSGRYGKNLAAFAPGRPLIFTRGNAGTTFYQDAPVTYAPRPAHPRHRNRGAATVTVADLAGTVAITFSHTGAIVGQAVIDASAALAFAASSAVTGVGVSAGSSALTFIPAATGVGSAVVSGSSTMTFVVTSTLDATGVVSGSSALAFASTSTLVGTAVTSGSSAITFSSTSSLSAYVDVSGSVALTFSSSSALVGKGVVTASSTITFASSSALVGQGVISGSSSLTFTASGSTSTIATLLGSASLAFTSSAALVGIGVSAASSAIAFTPTGEVSGVAVSEGSSTLTFSVSADLVGTASLSGDVEFTFHAHAHPDDGVPWYAECVPPYLVLTTDYVVVSELSDSISTESVLSRESPS